MSGLIGHNESILMVAVYLLSDLRAQGTALPKRRVIAMTKSMEELLRRGLTADERLKAARCVAIMETLEAKWQFDWTASSTSHGQLVRRNALIDGELFDAIESPQAQACLSWLHKGQPVDSLKIHTQYSLVADYGTVEIVEWELQFANEADLNQQIMWEGELHKTAQPRTTRVEFVLFFKRPGDYVFIVRHTTDAGSTAPTPLLAKVAAK
jgi:hypothetical protein